VEETEAEDWGDCFGSEKLFVEPRISLRAGSDQIGSDRIGSDRRQVGVVWTGFIWFRIVVVEGSSEHENELSGSVTFWEILEYLSDAGFLKRLSFIELFREIAP
jgi:hypothetical protein